MIDILKNEIEEKIGLKIQNRGDCELLSDAILEILDIHVSYNTIRRLYNLAPYTKPNSKTLNTLALFAGYKSYIHFIKNHQIKEKVNLSLLVFKAVNTSDEKEIIQLVKTTKRSSNDFSSFIVILIRELFHDKNFKLINTLFKLDELAFDSFSYSEVLFIGNSIGLLFRKHNFLDTDLLNNSNFLQCIFLIFVDYSNINGYYGDWAVYINKRKETKEFHLFTTALLEFKNFLNTKKVNDSFDNLAFSADLNPILCSRLLSVKLLAKNYDTVDELLNKYYKGRKKKATLTDYSYELFTIAILTKNIDVMKYLIDIISSNKNLKFYYQKYHLNSFYLMCAFYYKLTGKKSEHKKYAKLFNIQEVWFSYQEYIKLLHLIYLYPDAKNKTEIINEYTTLSTVLKCSYFSESYLVTYFK